jgi:hypothetical protein
MFSHPCFRSRATEQSGVLGRMDQRLLLSRPDVKPNPNSKPDSRAVVLYGRRSWFPCGKQFDPPGVECSFARPARAPAGGTPTAAMHRKQCLRGRIACLDARRLPASAALARTTGVPLRGRPRRFGVLHALLGGHLPHDERPGVHLAIEVALPLLLAMLLAFLWCRHGFSLVVCQSQRYASVVLLPAAHVDGAQPSRTARRTHGHSLRKSVRRRRAPPSLCGFSDSCTMHTSIAVLRAPPGSALDEWLVAHDRRLFARGCAGRSAAR